MPFILVMRNFVIWASGNIKNSLNFLFARNVKSIDELINRFNGTESHPDIAQDSLSRRNNILALFNRHRHRRVDQR